MNSGRLSYLARFGMRRVVGPIPRTRDLGRRGLVTGGIVLQAADSCQGSPDRFASIGLNPNPLRAYNKSGRPSFMDGRSNRLAAETPEKSTGPATQKGTAGRLNRVTEFVRSQSFRLRASTRSHAPEPALKHLLKQPLEQAGRKHRTALRR